MINKEKIIASFKKIAGFEQNLSSLSAREIDQLLSQQIGFYSGLPLPEIAATLVGISSGITLAFKSIKRVRPGELGARITKDKVSDEILESGWYLTDPSRVIQQITVSNARPASAKYKGVGRGLLGDGTEISGDITLTLEILNPKDAFERIEGAPKVDLHRDSKTERYTPGVEQFLTGIVGPEADYAGTEATTSVPSALSLTQENEVKKLREKLRERAQERLDEVILGHDPTAMQKIAEAKAAGVERREVRRGVLVSNAVFENFQPSEEVVESFQELVGAPMRTQAEVILKENLQEGYVPYSARRAAIESAERGGVGGIIITDTRVDPAAAGLLARAAQTEGGVSGGTRKRLQGTRERLRGRRKR